MKLPIPTHCGDVLILLTDQSFTLHVVGLVTTDGQQHFHTQSLVKYAVRRATAVTAAKALAVGGRIFFLNIDTSDWSEISNHRRLDDTNTSSEELCADGFWRAGTVVYPPGMLLRVDINRDVHGFVVYLMVVNHEVMKAGHTTTPLSTRMRSTFNALKNTMGDRADHSRYQEKTFKAEAQATVRAKREVELWAQEYPSRKAMIDKEETLNAHYQGLWTKEGKR